MSIESNIRARQEAQAVISLCGGQTERFWECLEELARAERKELPVDSAPQVMTDSEAISFEKSELPYGKYSGLEVGEVPLDYLLFLAEGDQFTKRLKKYVASPMFQSRQDDQ